MKKKLITLLIATSAISLSAQAETTVVEHYCGKDGVKFKQAVQVEGAQRVYVGFGGKTQVLAKDKVTEPESLVEELDAEFKSTQGCQDFLIRRYKQDPVARVTFEFNKDTVTPAAKFILDGVDGKDITYNIVGNTDSVGTETYNLELGGARAHEVAQYLEEQGLPYGSVRVISLGEMSPIAQNSTAEGRALNRRVDITVSE